MRLTLFRTAGAPAAPLRIGALLPAGAGEAKVADVTTALEDAGHGTLSSMRRFLELGEAGSVVAAHAVKTEAYHRKLAEVDLRAPIYDW
jgi:hypothetical protein